MNEKNPAEKKSAALKPATAKSAAAKSTAAARSTKSTAAVSAAERFASLIRCPTVSLPVDKDTQQNDMQSDVFDRFHAELKKNYPAVFKACERIKVGRYPLVLRWKGKDSSASVVFAAHQDVVPAADHADRWKYEPFAGTLAEGAVWGRGALDDKGSLCAIFEACESLAAENFTPSCDIYLCFSHNEETMGWGARAIADELERRGVKPLFVLDEGGAVVEKPLPLMKGKAAMIGITEKGVADVRFCARSTGGHASTPPKQSPLGALGAFASSVEKKSPLKTHMTGALARMLSVLSRRMSFPLNVLFRFPHFFAPLIRAVFKASGGAARALVQTSCAFTMAQGSDAVNVLPASAFLTANLRISGGDTLDSVMDSLQKRSAKYGIRAELIRGHEASPESVSNRGWDILCKALDAQFPGVSAVPYIMLAASDARHYCKLCPAVYRFTPFEMTDAQRGSVHGVDEHLEIENFERGVRFYRDVMQSI